MKSSRLYFFQAAIILGVLAVGFDLLHRRISVPVVCEGDALDFLAVARAFLEGDSMFSIHRLSAPHGLSMIIMPLCGFSEYALIKIFTWFASSPGAVLNEAYFASFVLTGLSACWCLRRLGFDAAQSLVVATLYAFLPWAFYRNIGHFNLFYYFVPFAATSAILIWSDTLHLPNRRDRWILGLGTCCVGLNYVYMPYFACFLLGMAGIGSLARTRRWDGMKAAGVRIGAIVLLVFLGLLPSIVAWRHDPSAGANIMSHKTATESDILGLKMRHLFTPRLDHPIVAFVRYAQRTYMKFPLDNENSFAQLGIAGSIGLLFLLGFVSLGLRKSPSDHPDARIAATANLNLSALLLGTMGGFGSIFSTLVSVQIRNYNRISIFIAFFSLVGFAHLLRLVLRGRRPTAAAAIGAAVLVLALWDQANFDLMREFYPTSVLRYDEAKNFTAKIEALEPPNAAIYQLPDVPYPFTSDSIYHSHFLPYSLSHTLRWSWPSLDGPSIAFHQQLAQLSDQALGANLTQLGFRGVWIDRRGYPDNGRQIVAALESASGSHHLDSAHSDFAFVRLNPKGSHLWADDPAAPWPKSVSP